MTEFCKGGPPIQLNFPLTPEIHGDANKIAKVLAIIREEITAVSHLVRLTISGNGFRERANRTHDQSFFSNALSEGITEKEYSLQKHRLVEVFKPNKWIGLTLEYSDQPNTKQCAEAFGDRINAIFKQYETA